MKSIEDIRKIAVVGSGTMGAAIAQLAAMAGYDTLLYDVKDEALGKAEVIIEKNLEGGIKRGKISEAEKQATLGRLTLTNNFQDLRVDFIIEAIIEKLDLKQELFEDLADQNDENTIFATNTSSIPITKIAVATPNPERVVGMHFFNPAHIMKLVEVISGVETVDTVVNTTVALAEKMGKKAVKANDAPGFIVNRVARHFYVEGLKILEENVADHETIDQLMKSSGFKMGPFGLMDLIGVDSNFLVTKTMFDAFHQDGKFRPSRIQEQLVNAGKNGRKSREGFYKYD